MSWYIGHRCSILSLPYPLRQPEAIREQSKHVIACAGARAAQDEAALPAAGAGEEGCFFLSRFHHFIPHASMQLPHGLPPRPSVVPIMPAAASASGLYLAAAAAEDKAAPSAAPALTVGTLIYAIGTLDYTFANGARRDLLVQEMLPGTPFLRHDEVVVVASPLCCAASAPHCWDGAPRDCP